MSRIQRVTALAGLFAGLAGCDSPPTERLTEPEAGMADATTGTAATVYYTPTYLSKTNGIAYDVNNKGQVVGIYTTSTQSRAFLWEKGVRKDLGSLGGNYAVAYAINDAGQIVGESSLPNEVEIHAVLWQNGVIKDLGTLGWTGGLGAPASEAVGINARGQAVGWSYTLSGNLRAFLYKDGKMRRLTGLETTVARAYGIDSLGRVVGHLGDFTAPRAFRWQAGVLTKLGTLGGPTSKARAINNAGKIVGWATKASGAFRAFLWQNGVMTDLGTLGGSSSEATAINKSGQVTGTAATATGEGHAFVWKSGVMSDVGRGQGQGLNDSGWVVGGRVDQTVSGTGGYLPVLWRPTSTPPVPPPPGVVSVGNTFFISNRNFSINPAVDTIPVGKTFTWTWVGGGTHNVQSTGSPSFPSSALISTKGAKYTYTFTQKGTYQYNCIRHPGTMTGRVLVR
jgi:probable HAF family extracellular repeat protein